MNNDDPWGWVGHLTPKEGGLTVIAAFFGHNFGFSRLFRRYVEM
jgi:hypothetical protein